MIRGRTLVLLLLGAFSLLALLSGCSQQGCLLSVENVREWRWVAGGNFSGVTYGDGLYVAVGYDGTILTSTGLGVKAIATAGQFEL